jgi:hypothetical protein
MATNQHDPFSFGQVRLGKEPASGAVEDLLFSQPGGSAADSGRDTSWDPPPQFAEEIAPAQAKAPPQPAVARKSEPARNERLSQQTMVDAAMCDAAMADPQPKREVAPPRARLDSHNVIRPESPTAHADVAFHEAAIPAAVFLVVESLAAYAWTSMDQPVLAALGAVLGCGLAAFAWFAVRR